MSWKNWPAICEDLQWMVATGEHPIMAAQRVGYRNPTSLWRALVRAGHPDLAAYFAPSAVLAADEAGATIHHHTRHHAA